MSLSSLRCIMLASKIKLQNSAKVVETYNKNQLQLSPHTQSKVKTKSIGAVSCDIKKECDREKIPSCNNTDTPLTEFEEFEKEDHLFQHILTHFRFFRDRLILLFPRPIYMILAMTMMVIVSFPFWKQYLYKFSTGRFGDFYCLVGLLVTLKCMSNCASVVWSKCISNNDVFKKAGSWAVVTGCTNGIGKEYALQLAAKGMNVILISRNAKLLEDLALDIGHKYGVRAMVIVMDFTTDDAAEYKSLAKQLQGYDIGVLVNNVGISSDPHLFHEMTPQFASDLINVNMLSLAKMCEIVLPEMAVRRRGVVINLSSALGTHPVSFVSLYGASKRFVDMFSRSIETEYKSRRIVVQSVTPYFISTNMTKGVDTEFFIPDAKTFVTNALATVGRDTRTYGYWRHALQGALMRDLPNQAMYQLMKLMKYRSEKLDKDRSLIQ